MAARDPFAGYHEQITKTVLQSVASVELFSGLEEPELARVAAYMNFFDVDAGDVVFLEGEAGDYVCFVAYGALEVSKTADGGGRKVIAALSAGNSIGEMAVVDSFPRSANVIALAPTRLLTLTRNDFEAFLQKEPQLGIRLLMAVTRVLSSNLRRTSTSLAANMLPIL